MASWQWRWAAERHPRTMINIMEDHDGVNVLSIEKVVGAPWACNIIKDVITIFRVNIIPITKERTGMMRT